MTHPTDEPDDALELGPRLIEATQDVQFAPDWADLTARIEVRHRRQRNALAALVAVALLLGGVGGYAWGARGRDDTVTLRVAGPAVPDETSNDAAADITVGSADPEGTAPRDTLRFARDFAPDSRMRVHDVPTSYAPSPPDPNRPLECQSSAAIAVSLSDPEMTASLNAGMPPDGSGPLSTMYAGSGTFSSPRSFVFVVVSGVGEAEVRAEFPGGSDEMTAIDGLAVLATTIDTADLADVSTTRITVGDEAPTEVDVADIYTASTGTPIYRRQLDCSAPLPAPGEQPADPSAEREALVAAMSTIVDGSVPFADKARFIDDPSGLQTVLDKARQAYPLEVNGSRFELVDLVFTDPDHAVIKFNVVFPAESALSSTQVGESLIGKAVRVDGRWVASRSSVCELMSLTGSSCP